MFIHKTAVLDENIILGKNISIWHFCHVMSDSKIGDNSVLGQNVMIGKSVIIGKGCNSHGNDLRKCVHYINDYIHARKKYRGSRALDQHHNVNKHRMAARGNASSFPLP